MGKSFKYEDRAKKYAQEILDEGGLEIDLWYENLDGTTSKIERIH
jgi:hypothetical protein